MCGFTTVFLDFTLNPERTKDQNGRINVGVQLESVLQQYFNGIKPLSTIPISTKSLLKIWQISGDNETVITARILDSGLVGINVEYPTVEATKDTSASSRDYEWCKRLGRTVAKDLVDVRQAHAHIPLKRCRFVGYYPTSDERLLEYDIDRTVYETQSPYQKIQIVHSKSLGNMLVLDDLQNISEADLIYTESLMARGVEHYENKDILILGGGDGALLYELLKEQPRYVHMLEIDEVVMNACAQHMRTICGDVLDRHEGPNYKIVVGDCLPILDQYIGESRRFDYIFGDLTDIPIGNNVECDNTAIMEQWYFLNTVLKKSFQLLKQDGKYMTHVIGAGSTDALAQFRNELDRLEPKVEYTMTMAFVPSFLEQWVFCQIRFA